MTPAMKAATDQIKAADGLYPLLAALNHLQSAFDDWNYDGSVDMEHVLHEAGIDLCMLPTFGGEEPDSTIGVWSWDEDELLVGEGSFYGWHIVPRNGEIDD